MTENPDAAREAARRPNGEFGTQPRAEAVGDGGVDITGPRIWNLQRLDPYPARPEPRLAGLTQAQHEARERAYLAQVAAILRTGERPLTVVEVDEPHTTVPSLEFTDFDSTHPFRVSANVEGSDDETDPVFREMNIVPATADEFPRLPRGLDEGDAELAAAIIQAYIIRRAATDSDRLSGL